MKQNVLKIERIGIAVSAVSLCAGLLGCGGGGASPEKSIPIGGPLPVICSNTANAARFQVDDFGAGFFPAAANASGQVAGYKVVNGKDRTVVTKNGTSTDIGLDDSIPVTINNVGQVAGNTTKGFVWQNGQTAFLKNLPGGTVNLVTDMNNNGELVGVANTGQKAGSGADIYHAVYWASAQATPQDLGVLNAGDDQSKATSINDHGQIVGFSGKVSGQSVYVYFASHSAKMQDLGIVEGMSGSWGAADLGTIFIGNSGLIVGTTFYNGAADSQVFLTKPGSSPTYNTTLGAPSKPNSTDQFIATTKAGGFSLYEPGKGAQDLIAQLPSSCSVSLASPVAIADGGQIVANGTVNGVNHGFLIAH